LNLTGKPPVDNKLLTPSREDDCMFKFINLQLFAEDTIPEKGEEADNMEDIKERNPFAKLFTKDYSKEPEKKEPEKKPDETEVKQPDEKQDEKPEDKSEVKKEPETKDPEEPKKEEFITIKHLKKEVQIPASERDKYLQMGYDYPHVKEEATKSKSTLLRIAKLEGFNTVDEYLAELDKREKAKVAEQIEEAAGDPDKIDEIVKNHPEVLKTKEERLAVENEKRQMAFEKIKAELSKDRFYKELEPEFDELMEKNPAAEPNLVYSVLVGNYVRSGKFNELIAKEKESAEKKVLADVHDKERRATPTGGDTDEGKDVVQPSELGKKLAGIFGVSAAKIAQRSHEKLKRR
jgi:hypothetical protein